MVKSILIVFCVLFCERKWGKIATNKMLGNQTTLAMQRKQTTMITEETKAMLYAETLDACLPGSFRCRWNAYTWTQTQHSLSNRMKIVSFILISLLNYEFIVLPTTFLHKMHIAHAHYEHNAPMIQCFCIRTKGEHREMNIFRSHNRT